MGFLLRSFMLDQFPLGEFLNKKVLTFETFHHCADCAELFPIFLKYCGSFNVHLLCFVDYIESVE